MKQFTHSSVQFTPFSFNEQHPQALGVHKHDHGDDGHGHGTEPSGGAEEEMSDAKRRNITIGINLKT